MTDAPKVRVYELGTVVRQFEIAYEDNGLARLYCEEFQVDAGTPQSTSRLHFDGDVRADVMRAIIEQVATEVLAGMPRGVCVIYRGHLFSSFDYGRPPIPA